MGDRIRGGAHADAVGIEVFVGTDDDGNESCPDVLELVIGDERDAFSVTGSPAELRRVVSAAFVALNAVDLPVPDRVAEVGVPVCVAGSVVETDDAEEPFPFSWSQLSTEDERAAWQKFFETNRQGLEIMVAANGDRDFAVWLTAAVVRHWSIAVRPIEDVAAPSWRARYNVGWTPEEAVQAEVASRVVMAGGRLMCPHCGVIDRIVEVGVTGRELVGQNDGVLAAPSDVHPVCWRCVACRRMVARPAGAMVSTQC